MIKSKLIIITSIISFSYFTIVAQESTTNALYVSNNIQYSEFSKHLEYLSSDEVKGRDTGSEGFAVAADYVANEFKKNGLVPFGDENTFFQKVPLTKRSLIKSSISVQAVLNNNKVEGVYGENISFLLNPNFPKIDEKQNLVFVGYGNIIPKDSINDYEGLNVKGKTVIAVLGAPKNVKSRSANNPFVKVKNALNNGADGIILFYPGGLIQGLVYKEMHSFLGEPMVALTDTSIAESMFDIDLKIGAFAKKDLIKDIFKLNGLKLRKELKAIKKGDFASKDLKSVLNCTFNINEENIECKNVVAMLPGTDSTLKNEYIVLGGHLDHLGIGDEVKGDSIYNGMWDNASGSAAIISISKAYSELSDKSKRSVIFVCYTGEEKGLLGSTYFAYKNKVIDWKIIANINIDMLGNLFETTDIIPLGYSHSNLSEAVDFAASSLNLIIDDNKREENMYLERSDQISFIKNEVPALNIGSGYTAVNSKIDAQK
ncbi:MAG: M28 family peptidase, partial [Bacteroidales bacterium]|nr:M28 family peptidase [Bacteroidales bacterium]